MIIQKQGQPPTYHLECSAAEYQRLMRALFIYEKQERERTGVDDSMRLEMVCTLQRESKA